MKKRLSLFLSFVMLLSLMAVPVFAAEPAVTDNQYGHDYINAYRWPLPSYSALSYEASSGILTRVEYDWESILVERYDRQLNLLDVRNVEMELPIYGGFFGGKEFYFLVFGQLNGEQNDTKEVIRVVKYDKNWNRLGSASLYGANTTVPFDAGGMDMYEYNGYLYLRTAHEMYRSADGLNHQANLTMNVRISDMKVTDSFYAVMNSSYGYISHSFNQFIAVDESDGSLVAMDHGDAYPRSVVLTKYYSKAGQDLFTEKVKVPAPEYGPDRYRWAVCQTTDVLPIVGSMGANDTGVSMGGFEISDSAYLSVGTSIEQNPNQYDFFSQRNVYLTVTEKDLSETKVIWLTDFTEDDWIDVNNPFIVRISGDRFLILWSDGDYYEAAMHHVFVDGKGNLLTEVFTRQLDEGSWLSDCQPIVAGGQVIWYMSDGIELRFFAIDADCGREIKVPELGGEVIDPSEPEEPVNPFVDVEPERFYYNPVLWAVEKGITKGTDDTHFSPEETCTRAQVVTFLWRAAGSPEPKSGANPFRDVEEGSFYHKAVLWAVEEGITKGVSEQEFAPGETCTRGQVVTFLWRYAGQPQAEGSAPGFTDVKAGAFYEKAVAWAVGAEVTNGVGNGKFAPDEICTRGQVVTFLQRTAEE